MKREKALCCGRDQSKPFTTFLLSYVSIFRSMPKSRSQPGSNFVPNLIRAFYFSLFRLWGYKLSVLFSISLLILSIVAYHTPGPHQELIISIEKQVVWCLYWLGLGVLSSVGLGTGLHTFLLYLGPHIAAVTLAAYECGTLDFPSPPYPDRYSHFKVI